MSESSGHSFDPILLDLHLGHLTEAEQHAVRARIAADPALAAQDEALAEVFRALSAAPEERVPCDLAERVLGRVRAAGPPPRVIRPADELTRVLERDNRRVLRLGNLRDIVAVAALIVLGVGLGLPSMLHMRERQQRLGCSWNLAQLGAGLQQYASAFNASLPFAGWGSQHSWQANGDPAIVNMPNRRHVYPLLLARYVADPRRFVCPGQPHMPMPADEVPRRTDFLEDRNISYAYQNMAGVRPSTRDDPRLPILADENPLFADGVPLFDVRRLVGGDPALANSRAHRGAGQNILTLRGEVIWTRTPLSGVDGDNIWILRDVAKYTGREGPLTATDSHLLK